MCQPPSRSRTVRRRVAAAATCLSLGLAGGAPAADIKPLRLVVSGPPPGAAAPGAPPAANPQAGPDPVVGLLQDLQRLLDWVFAGQPVDAAPAAGQPAAFAAGGAPGPAVEIVPYAGPLAAGTIILNLDRLRVYRVLGGGWAELYQETSEAAVLARLGMAR